MWEWIKGIKFSLISHDKSKSEEDSEICGRGMESFVSGSELMNPMEKLQDALSNEIQQQYFYNEQLVEITNPAVR